MIHLVHLKINFQPSQYNDKLRCHVSTNKIATKTAALQVCWIIQQSPHITHLHLDQLSVSNLKEMELLALTLHGLLWLQEIRLFIRSDKDVWQRGFYKIFFALPVLVTVCKLGGEPPLNWTYYWHETDLLNYELKDSEGESELDTEDDEESGRSRQKTSDDRKSVEAVQENKQVIEEKDQELVIPEVFSRDEPLSQLQMFQAWDMNLLTMEEVLSVFYHCPNVVSLRVPLVSAIGEDLDILARTISERCPHLWWLSSRQSDATLFTAVMKAMPDYEQLKEHQSRKERLLRRCGSYQACFC
ncbi:hypothetical protein BGZ95_006127 [Linnemannia exigua]|uniref:Uncharacterized protein n=1 Tax=Linnemannia exigua TaxID=604196 RepID=A0AAD4D1K1_9FUNG|nr:hypothetical protein BGZ95_006127 [Linnemannia exigua]